MAQWWFVITKTGSRPSVKREERREGEGEKEKVGGTPFPETLIENNQKFHIKR